MQAFNRRNALVIIFSVVLAFMADTLITGPQRADEQGLSIQPQNQPANKTMELKSLSPQQNKQAASVEDLLVKLELRLERQADDMQGWLLLAKSYRYLQRDSDAESALKKAQALGFDGTLDTQQTGTVRKPDPLAQLTTPMPMSHFLQDYLANNVTQSRVSALGNQHLADESKGTILLKVALSEALNQTVNPDTAVFIFVRPYINQQVNAEGPPLAAVRKTVRDLPLYIALNDKMAMLPGRTISSAAQVVVGARLAISGDPVKQAGDIEQLSQAISTAEQATLSLVITHDLTVQSQS